MDEQQLTQPEEIQWYERQKQLSHYLTTEEPARLASALELFLEQHAQLHSPNGLAHSALEGLSDEQWRLKPGPGTNSVIWLVLHMARIEDVTFNLLVMERAQVFAEWFEHLGFDRRDVGTGMSDEEVLELSKTIDLRALRAYWSAVGKTTQDLARALHPMTLKERPDKRNMQRLFVNFEILWAEFCSLRGRQNEQKGAATVLRLTGRELFPLCWLFLASCDSPA